MIAFVEIVVLKLTLLISSLLTFSNKEDITSQIELNMLLKSTGFLITFITLLSFKITASILVPPISRAIIISNHILYSIILHQIFTCFSKRKQIDTLYIQRPICFLN